jgi:hypothetical protein
MEKIAPYYKAITGALAPGVGILIYALLETSPGGSEIVQEEWLLALFTIIGSGGLVFAVPTKDPEAAHQDESVQPPGA